MTTNKNEGCQEKTIKIELTVGIIKIKVAKKKRFYIGVIKIKVVYKKIEYRYNKNQSCQKKFFFKLNNAITKIKVV